MNTERHAAPYEPLTPLAQQLLRKDTVPQARHFGVIRPDTYPFYAPYRVVSKTNWSPQPAGRVPRLLSAIFSTLIHYNDPCWDPDTRTIWLEDGWTNITKTLNIYASATSRTIIHDCLEKMRRTPTASIRQCIAIESLDLDRDGRGAHKRSVTLTSQYVRACQQDLREVSFITMHDLTGAAALDLYALAALYAPDDGQLRATRGFLAQMLPGTKRRLGTPDRRDLMLAQLNAAQDRWVYKADGDEIAITARGVDHPDVNKTVVLA